MGGTLRINLQKSQNKIPKHVMLGKTEKLDTLIKK